MYSQQVMTTIHPSPMMTFIDDGGGNGGLIIHSFIQ